MTEIRVGLRQQTFKGCTRQQWIGYVPAVFVTLFGPSIHTLIAILSPSVNGLKVT